MSLKSRVLVTHLGYLNLVDRIGNPIGRFTQYWRSQRRLRILRPRAHLAVSRLSRAWVQSLPSKGRSVTSNAQPGTEGYDRRIAHPRLGDVSEIVPGR